MRDGVADFPRASQLEMLVSADIPIDQLFEDRLSRDKIKRRRYADLTDLAIMLAPPNRTTPETIFVATPLALGWGITDIAKSIAAAGRRHAAVVFLDTETVIPAGAGPEVLDLLADIEEQRQRAKKNASISKGRIAAKRRADRLWAKAYVIAKPLWDQPYQEWPASRIKEELAAHGINYSIKTLRNRLGARADAQTTDEDFARERWIRGTA